MQHARDALDDDVVDGVAEEALLAARDDGAREEQAVLDAVVAVEEFLRFLLGSRVSMSAMKPSVPMLTPQTDSMVAVAAADAQERAVAADAQRDVCLDVLDVGDAVARVLEDARLLYRQHDDAHVLCPHRSRGCAAEPVCSGLFVFGKTAIVSIEFSAMARSCLGVWQWINDPGPHGPRRRLPAAVHSTAFACCAREVDEILILPSAV